MATPEGGDPWTSLKLSSFSSGLHLQAPARKVLHLRQASELFDVGLLRDRPVRYLLPEVGRTRSRQAPWHAAGATCITFAGLELARGFNQEEHDELRRLHYFNRVGSVAGPKVDRFLELRLQDRRQKIRPPREFGEQETASRLSKRPIASSRVSSK